MGGYHQICKAAKPPEGEKDSRAALLCKMFQTCEECTDNQCNWDPSGDECVLGGHAKNLIGHGGRHSSCEVYANFLEEGTIRQNQEDVCRRIRSCDTCLQHTCAWCIGASECTPEGSMQCKNARDEVSRFDGHYRTCTLGHAALED